MYDSKRTSNRFAIPFFRVFLFLIMPISLCEAKKLALEFGKELPAGCLSIQFLQKLKDTFNADVFIETGTCEGMTAKNAAQVFDQVETIELCKQLYDYSKRLWGNTYKNIRFHHGDSGLILDEVLKTARGNILLWLDGHYSGINPAMGGTETALGCASSPIMHELKCVKKTGITRAVIMIDDIRLCDKYINKLPQIDLGGYPTIPEICTLLLEINPNYEVVVMGDILMAYEKNESIKISDVLRACSYTRTNLTISKNEQDKAMKIIGNAKGIELSAINSLYNDYCLQDNFKKYGIGAHYSLWHAFVLMNNELFDEALAIFRGPINLGMDPFYIKELMNEVSTMMATA